MLTCRVLVATRIILCLSLIRIAAAQDVSHPDKSAGNWTFSVSGDSRNCGNVVMPAIAAAVKDDGAVFYWHLGDYRAIYKFDEDYLAEPNIPRDNNDPMITAYLSGAWTDFIAHQLEPFKVKDIPVYLAAGNHESILPFPTREKFLEKFAGYLDTPELTTQRLKDNPLAKAPASYYHWVRGRVDFISLDNSVNDSYDEAQLNWFFSILLRDEGDNQIRSVVVGMHEALPDSLAADHSMCKSQDVRASGRAVYRALAHAQQVAHKNVYVLASHSHYFLENIYNTSYWNDPKNGRVVLPGWIVGTAGAVRYKLPLDLPPDTAHGQYVSRAEHVYGYMNGTVAADGTITFAFHELDEKALQQTRSKDYTQEFVSQCVRDNPREDKADKTPDNDMPKKKPDDPCMENTP